MSGTFDSEERMDQLEVKVQCLDLELQTTQEQVSRLKASIDMKDTELKKKSEELTELTNQVKVDVESCLGLAYCDLTVVLSCMLFSLLPLKTAPESSADR